MWPTRAFEISQHTHQDLQDDGLFLIHRGDTLQQAAIPAHGFDDVEGFESLKALLEQESSREKCL